MVSFILFVFLESVQFVAASTFLHDVGDFNANRKRRKKKRVVALTKDDDVKVYRRRGRFYV